MVRSPALVWARRRLAERGVEPLGAARAVKRRSWSQVYLIESTAGPVYLKAGLGGTGYEAALVPALARFAPGRVVEPWAVDTQRGWLLLPSGGVPVRDLPGACDPATWERVVSGYGELQRAVAPHAAELLALGVPDHRPGRLPDLLTELLATSATLTPADRARLTGVLPRFAEACAELAAVGPASTVQHDDLHTGNVLAGPFGERVFDWGDANVGHPFTSLLVTLRSWADGCATGPDDPALARVRDAYLEPWGLDRDGPRLAGLAAWTGCVGRALAWQRALADVPRPTPDPIGGWLVELLADPTPGLPGPGG
jgi:hypothetical protein